MDINQRNIGDICVFSICGNLDTTTSPDAEKAIMERINEGSKKIVISLKETVYISSSGLRVMLSTAKKLKGNGELRISDLNDMVEEVFTISGFIDILNVDSTEEEAISAIK